MDPTYPLVPIANLLASVLVLLPFSRQALRSWNIGVCLFAFWLVVQTICVGVGGIIWRDNTDNVAPVWCDITTHLEVGLNIAGVACTLAIARWLYNVTRLREVIPGKKRAHWSLAIDIMLCVGLPVLAMILYYTTQGARFTILEEYGCSVLMITSIISYLLVSLVPILLSLISLLFYTPRTLWTLYKQYKEVNSFLSTDNTPIDRPSYIRLFILSALDIILTLPLLILITISQFANGPVLFWPGWSFIHQDIGQVVQASTEEWSQLGGFWLKFHLKWNQWIGPFWAVIFFALFGMTRDARKKYRAVFWAVMKPFGLKPHELGNAPEEQIFYAQPQYAPASISAFSSSRRASQASFDLEGSRFLEGDLCHGERSILVTEKTENPHHAGVDERQDISCVLESPNELGAPIDNSYPGVHDSPRDMPTIITQT